MGSFDLWRGNLGQMRGDSPGGTAPTPQNGANSERFLQTLAVSRAFDRMPSKCAEVVRRAYMEKHDREHVAKDFGTSADFIEFCTERLFEVASDLYEELSSGDIDEFESDTHSAIPLSTHADHETPAERK